MKPTQNQTLWGIVVKAKKATSLLRVLYKSLQAMPREAL
jgi:hypothetical protein